jgi:hypothetical protein
MSMHPFALSLSKRRIRVDQDFDELSPNGFK